MDREDPDERDARGRRCEFGEGDPVEIRQADEPAPFARGLTRYAASALREIRGLPSTAIRERLGFSTGDAVVHKDDLVLL